MANNAELIKQCEERAQQWLTPAFDEETRKDQTPGFWLPQLQKFQNQDFHRPQHQTGKISPQAVALLRKFMR